MFTLEEHDLNNEHHLLIHCQKATVSIIPVAITMLVFWLQTT